jgi:hypothetical protein
MKRGKQKKKKEHQTPNRTIGASQKISNDCDTQQEEQGHQAAMNHPRFTENRSDSKTGVWTVTLTAIIAVIYFLQLNAMWDTVNVARRSSERQDRAWVAVQPKGPYRITAGEELGIPFVLVNTGKTPARHIHTEIWTKFIPTTSLEEMSETGPRLQVETGDLFPNNINEIDGFSTLHATRQRGIGNHDTRSWAIEPSEVIEYDAGRIYGVGYMVVSYEDIFGIKHWTRYCSYIHNPINNPNTSSCVSYNREDDNEEP